MHSLRAACTCKHTPMPPTPSPKRPSPPLNANPAPHSGALLERVEARAYSERYIATLVRSILRFIAQCHAKGIVYRDVKPGEGRGGLWCWAGGEGDSRRQLAPGVG
jgi:hypothetical protein